jgi:hypothetical protein
MRVEDEDPFSKKPHSASGRAMSADHERLPCNIGWPCSEIRFNCGNLSMTAGTGCRHVQYAPFRRCQSAHAIAR